jgi:glucose/arabinose dehydrogenase
MLIFILFLDILLIGLLSFYSTGNRYTIDAIDAQPQRFPETLPISEPEGGPTIVNDSNLKIETVFRGLNLSTSMAFLGPNDILVLEKDNGTVKRIVNGKVMPNSLVDVNVATQGERGMLGIAISKNRSSIPAFEREDSYQDPVTFVFLYYTEQHEAYDNVYAKNPTENVDVIQNTTTQGLSNHLYRYEMDYQHNKLTNRKLLLDLPASPPPASSSILSSSPGDHNGGKVIIGPDENVYVTIGDVGGHRGLAQNEKNRSFQFDGTSGILRVTQDGRPVPNGPLGNTYPLNLYYAYGIRNSFGIDFDPVTGQLWDTENGPAYADEINLVAPGFNSGWDKVQGKWKPNLDTGLPGNETSNPVEELVYAGDSGGDGGKGEYSSPEFTFFQRPLGPTALKFFNSKQLGEEYVNDLFVGDIHKGNIYHFELNANRTELVFPEGPLSGKIAYFPDDPMRLVFAHGFGGITDLQIGNEDGYLYVLSYSGDIYRIVPSYTK